MRSAINIVIANAFILSPVVMADNSFVFFSFTTPVLSFFAQCVPTFSLLLNTKLSIVCCIRDITDS